MGAGKLDESYKKALRVVEEKEGDLKDYTYLALLVTETEKVYLTENDFINSGILHFVDTKLRNASSIPPPILTLAINFAELMLKVNELRVVILELVNVYLDDICNTNNYSVLAALFQFCITTQKSHDVNSYCHHTTAILTQRTLLDKVIEHQDVAASYHVNQLALSCFLAILTFLSQEKSFPSSTSQGDASHVNFAKLRHNALLDFFEKVRKRKMICLQYMLLNCQHQNLVQQLREFVQAKLSTEERKLSVKNSPNYTVLLLSLEDNDVKDLLQNETESNVKMRLLYQMVKLCDKRSSFEQMLLHYFEQCTQTSFLLHNNQLNSQESELRYFLKEDLAKHLTKCSQLFNTITNKCINIWKLHKDLSEGQFSYSVILCIVRFLQSCLQFQHKLDVTEFLQLCADLIQKFFGVPDNIKRSVCQLLVLAVESSSISIISQTININSLINSLAYLSVNSATSWEMKDEALTVLSAILLKYECGTEEREIVKNVIQSSLSHHEMYIRQSAFKLMSSFITGTTQTISEEIQYISNLQHTFTCDQEAIVRRGAVDFLSEFVLKVSDQNLGEISNIGQHLLFDPDWEVKLKSAKFWSNMVDRLKCGKSLDQLMVDLEVAGVYTALVHKWQDDELLVSEEFEKLTDKLVEDLDLAQYSLGKLRKLDLCDSEVNVKKDVDTSLDYDEEDVQDIIESVVEAQDKDLLTNLAEHQASKKVNINQQLKKVERITISRFIEHINNVHKHKLDRHQHLAYQQNKNLSSILEDILQSASGQNMVEDIDCYGG